MVTKVFINGVLFTGSELYAPIDHHYDSMVIEGPHIVHVGNETDDDVQQALTYAHPSNIVNLQKRIVVPGFIDAHVHILFFGLSLLKLDLEPCKSLQEMRDAISQYAKAHPDLPRIICRGWQQYITKGQALASTLDDLDSRPIFVEALDCHSSWCNTAALNELPLDRIKEQFPQYLPCDKDGNPVGLVEEMAMTAFIWPHLMDKCRLPKDPQARHRIEHLEVASAEDAARLGRLGITASIQPIHSDPARLVDYAKLVGPELIARAFPYREFLDGNAVVAIGSDAPTASHDVFKNLYSATTRKSANESSFAGLVNPSGALTLAQAMAAATSGAAYSRFADDWVGTLKAGLQADFLVLDTVWEPNRLLESAIWQTWSQGEKLYQG